MKSIRTTQRSRTDHLLCESPRVRRRAALPYAVVVAAAFVCSASARAGTDILGAGRLTATGAVTAIDGSAGGGINPWAVIAGYGADRPIGGAVFYTHLTLPNFQLTRTGQRLDCSTAPSSPTPGKTSVWAAPGHNVTARSPGCSVRPYQGCRRPCSWCQRYRESGHHRPEGQALRQQCLRPRGLCCRRYRCGFTTIRTTTQRPSGRSVLGPTAAHSTFRQASGISMDSLAVIRASIST